AQARQAAEARARAEAAKKAEEDKGGGIMGWVHGGLDVAGLVPVFGEAADLVNAGIYLAEGDKLNAGISGAAAIPFAGWAATGAKGVKYAANGAEALDTARDTARAADAGQDAGRASDSADELYMYMARGRYDAAMELGELPADAQGRIFATRTRYLDGWDAQNELGILARGERVTGRVQVHPDEVPNFRHNPEGAAPLGPWKGGGDEWIRDGTVHGPYPSGRLKPWEELPYTPRDGP
nr:hypothetical protein [Actinomycetota bacterium]